MTERTLSRADIEDLPQRFRAEFVNSLSGFKSASLMATQSISGDQNVCIVSSVTHIGANPPLIGIIMRPHTVQRDTLENIKLTSVFTLNNVTESMAQRAHQTSARYDKSISEFDEVSLTPIPSQVIEAPYVAESTLKMSLRVRDIIPISINSTELVIGEIQEVILPEKSIDKTGYVDIEQCGSLAISGLVSYHTTKRVARFGYAKPDHFVKNLLNEERNDP